MTEAVKIQDFRISFKGKTKLLQWCIRNEVNLQHYSAIYLGQADAGNEKQNTELFENFHDALPLCRKLFSSFAAFFGSRLCRSADNIGPAER